MGSVAFSGGKDSTAMLLMMLEKGLKIDKVFFIDTTKEYPQTYEHIEKVKAYIKPLEITTIPFDFDYWLGEHIKTKGKNKGAKGYGWPDFKIRWCTSFKRDIMHRLMPKKSIEYIGIAKDEEKRASADTKRNRYILYPLIDWNITQAQALEYCYAKGFTWGGLYKKFKRISCWCCPLKSIAELRTLHNDFPELWAKLKVMDQKSHRQFKSAYSVHDLERRFLNERIF